jgi:hypothetical protein
MQYRAIPPLCHIVVDGLRWRTYCDVQSIRILADEGWRGSHCRMFYSATLGQLIRKLLEKRDRTEAVEGFVLGAYRTFQIALVDLEEATGYDFGDLKDADPLARRQEARKLLPPMCPGSCHSRPSAISCSRLFENRELSCRVHDLRQGTLFKPSQA